MDLTKLKTKYPIIDKHSTGGVGDKVTLILAPIIASLGISVAKLSGKGLGFTGGTIDKLESIGCQTELSQKQMIKLLKENNLFVASQTKDIAPADKILYNLRDLTGTVDNYGLIASSILAKKFAIIGTHVFLDVKYGSGAFCQTYQQAKQLVKYLKYIAKKMERKLTIIISSMQQPLGKAIGNLIEIKEAIDFLSGNVANYPDLKKLIYEFAIKILVETKNISFLQAKKKIDFVIRSKKALNKFYL
ncbi:thymidine phosphorylase [bacterium]|nr:thymidine phosphorylase [bacterium]